MLKHRRISQVDTRIHVTTECCRIRRLRRLNSYQNTVLKITKTYCAAVRGSHFYQINFMRVYQYERI